MGIDLDLLLPSRGRPVRQVTATVVRELSEADLPLLVAVPPSRPYEIKVLRHRHHALARYLSEGMSDAQAAMITGFGRQRVVQLKHDPAFKQLMADMRSAKEVQLAEITERLTGLSVTAMDILAERLEEEPDEISVGQLHETIKLGTDRTGYGPQSHSTQVNFHVDISKRLGAARERVAEHRKMIDITPEAENADPS